MPNYADSKVYKITSPHINTCYVGSTTKKLLSMRLAKHVSKYKQYTTGKNQSKVTSFKILEAGNYQIELLENVKCETKDQLMIRERHYIELLDCVNKQIPTRTDKEYRKDNIDKILKYREDHKEQNKIYREENKENIEQRAKKYYETNKAKQAEKNKSKVHCSTCNCELTKAVMPRHNKSSKHLMNLAK